jgi:DNA-binding NarL/FixJ family response regulator
MTVRFSARHGDRVFKATLPLFDAIVAKRLGNRKIAERCGVLAATRFGELGFPLYEAMARELCGDVESAAATYRRIGAVRPLRELSGRALTAPPTDAAPRSAASLTKRERDVADLVIRGLSNPEIAARLDVSTKAVEKNLTSIYRKTGISSRSKLIAHVAASPIESDRSPRLVE